MVDSSFPTQKGDVGESALDKASKRARELQKKLLRGVVCSTHNEALTSASRLLVSEFMSEISKSRTTVEFLIDRFYSPKKKAAAHTVYTSARRDIKDLMSDLVPNPRKRGKILDSYDNLSLFWASKPGDDKYVKKKISNKNHEVLDEESLNFFDDSVASMFLDPDLYFFKELNAFYNPPMTYGNLRIEETINMMPAFIEMLDTNPFVFLSVVAHEAGHKVGPGVSKLNGYELSSEFRSLVACYKDTKSIKMLGHQADETIADYISSEVLARQINKLPENKRKQAMLSAMGDFCIFEDMGKHSIYCTGSHPENSLRVSGIYGANPSVRRVMGVHLSRLNLKPVA